MAEAAVVTESAHAEPGSGHGHAPAADSHHGTRLTPGKFAIWLFLATEVMFFTGLIGSYIVLRSGSPPRAYSHKYAPATPVSQMDPDDLKDPSLFFSWPQPYDEQTNPLNINLTALNTFILICSSVTMVL